MFGGNRSGKNTKFYDLLIQSLIDSDSGTYKILLCSSQLASRMAQNRIKELMNNYNGIQYNIITVDDIVFFESTNSFTIVFVVGKIA